MGKRITSVSKPAMDILTSYDWPGNVRELENVIERGLIITKSNTLEVGEWLPKISTLTSVQKNKGHSSQSRSLEDIERQHILETLHQTSWKIRGDKGAAKILKLNPTTLEARMKKLQIVRPK